MQPTSLTWLDRDHHYVREALTLLDAVLDTPSCPPPGSPGFRHLEHAVGYFRTDLIAHMQQEERVLFPLLRAHVAHEQVVGLELQHAEIAVLVRSFHAQVAALTHHCDAAHWRALGRLAERFKGLLFRHIDAEEALVAEMVRSEAVAIAPEHAQVVSLI